MDVDRISGLSDDLIHEIMSYLEMRQVAQTSILSKRWRNLWKSLRKLNIDDKPFFSETSFATTYLELAQRDIRFNDCIFGFLGYKYPRKIDRIRICCSNYEVMYEYPKFQTKYLRYINEAVSYCVLAAIDGNAQEVFIHNIPLIPEGSVILLQRWNFSHIKALHLTSVAIHPTAIHTGSLLLYFKFLETLTMDDCRHCGIKLVIIESPSLVNLTLQSNRQDTIEGVESCSLKLIGLRNLTNLYLKGYMYSNYIIQGNLPSLITAHLDTKVSNNRINDDKEEEGLSMCLSNLLRQLLSDAKSLTLNIDNGFACASPHWDTQLFISDDTKLHNLKSVQFNNFQWSRNELRLLQLLVENVVGFEKITIRAADTLPEDDEQTVKFMEFGRKLHSIPGASSHLVSVFLFKNGEVRIDKLSLHKPLKPPSMLENE